MKAIRQTQCSSSFRYLPNANSPKNTPARTDMKYPTFNVMTASILIPPRQHNNP